VMLMTSHKFLT